MNRDRYATLIEYIEQPEVQREILGDYKGGYSLGLTANPENRDELAIRVRIEGEDASVIPHQLTFEGRTIRIIVDTNFEIPKPLSLPHSEGYQPCK